MQISDVHLGIFYSGQIVSDRNGGAILVGEFADRDNDQIGVQVFGIDNEGQTRWNRILYERNYTSPNEEFRLYPQVLRDNIENVYFVSWLDSFKDYFAFKTLTRDGELVLNQTCVIDTAIDIWTINACITNGGVVYSWNRGQVDEEHHFNGSVRCQKYNTEGEKIWRENGVDVFLIRTDEIGLVTDTNGGAIVLTSTRSLGLININGELGIVLENEVDDNNLSRQITEPIIHFFPQPANSNISISFFNAKENNLSYKYIIMDISGRAFYSGYLNPFQITKLSVSAIPNGKYIIIIGSPNTGFYKYSFVTLK